MTFSLSQRLVLGGLALSSLLLSIIIQWKIIVGLGPGSMTDAYFASQVVPTVLMVIIGSSVSHVLVPFIIEMTPRERQANIWGLILAFAGIFGTLSVLLFIAAPVWVALLFPGFSDDLVVLTISLSRILSFILFFGGMSAVLTAVLQSQHHFILPELWMLVSIIVMLTGVSLGLSRFGIALVAWLSLFRHALQSILLLTGIPRPALAGFRLAILGDILQRIRPLLLGSSIYKTGPIIDRYLASLAPTGGITILAFAQQLYGIAITIADKAVATPFIAISSTLLKEGGSESVRRMYWRIWVWSLLVSLLMWGVVVLAGEWALGLFLGYGLMKPDDIAALSAVMTIMGGILAGGVTGQLSAAGLYACKKSSTVARIAIVNFIIASIIKISGFYFFGLYGIAMGIVAYQVLNAVMLHFKLDRTYREDYA